MTALFSTSGWAQAPESGAPPSKPAFNEAGYRHLDETLTALRARNAKAFAIDPVRGIDEGSYVRIGGIEQWITIRGEDRKNPVLLFLHGGPGDVTNPWSFAIFAPWEKHFTVVQWDERGAGRTFSKNGAAIASTMTLDRMAQDGIELSEYLRNHLSKEKIVVVAHSFGTVLGLRMVRARPDLYSAYVGTGEVADETKNYSAAYEALLKRAQVSGNQRALADLRRIGPPPYSTGEGYRVQWKWANGFEGADQFLFSTIGFALVSPGCSVQDFKDAEEGEVFSADRLVPQLRSSTPKQFGLSFKLPVFFFQGDSDFTAPTALVRQYFAMLQAPYKKLVLIPNAGHFAVFMRSDVFLKELVARVRPLAVRR
ncbi:MAG TPA: alpha/beta hydrolase [Fimbriimonadaceae bacterium]|nr:alpha/beta hydrolase [Fimbriimonadaceae bacterium]